MTESDLCNVALGKIGGAGDALNGNAFIASIDGNDKVSTFCKFSLPRVRRRAIIDLAVMECPFKATRRFADLGSAIDEDDTPEIGEYQYAFNLPGDYLVFISQFYESNISSRRSITNQSKDKPKQIQCDVIANKDGNGNILVTDTLSNLGGTSAFVEYVIDVPTIGAWSEQMVDCVATLLASELCPVVGRDMESRAAMMQEYNLVAIPAAQRANQYSFNNTARVIPDFSGGRSSGGYVVGVNTGLGTYEGSDGLRHEI